MLCSFSSSSVFSLYYVHRYVIVGFLQHLINIFFPLVSKFVLSIKCNDIDQDSVTNFYVCSSCFQVIHPFLLTLYFLATAGAKSKDFFKRDLRLSTYFVSGTFSSSFLSRPKARSTGRQGSLPHFNENGRKPCRLVPGAVVCMNQRCV